MGVPGVVVVNHPPDVDGVVPEVPESPRQVVALAVVLVGLVAHPGSEEGEALSDVLGVGVHEQEGGDGSELSQIDSTASPAAGKATLSLIHI